MSDVQNFQELDRDGRVALWAQIADQIQEKIALGDLPPGAQLPTEFALAKQFQVNRHTARRALQALQENGMVRIEQGRGSFVREDRINYTIGIRTRFSDILGKQNKSSSNDILNAGTYPAPAEVADALKVSIGTPLFMLETLGLADGVPVTRAERWFPIDRFPGFIDKWRELESVTRTFEYFNVRDYLRLKTEVTARLPDAREARLLDLGRGKPVLITTYVNVDMDRNPIQYGETHFASDRIQLVFDSSNQPVNGRD